MNKKISTRSGLITGILILAYLTLLTRYAGAAAEKYSLWQFGILSIGLLVSYYFLYHYYAGIRFSEAFVHGIKTLATTLVILIIGNSLLFLALQPAPIVFSDITYIIMKTIFSYSVSGVLSALFWSFIFNTFTKK